MDPTGETVSNTAPVLTRDLRVSNLIRALSLLGSYCVLLHHYTSGILTVADIAFLVPFVLQSPLQFEMLYLIGLGLGDAKDITVKGLEVVRRCSRVYLEAYTSVLTVGKETLVGDLGSRLRKRKLPDV